MSQKAKLNSFWSLCASVHVSSCLNQNKLQSEPLLTALGSYGTKHTPCFTHNGEKPHMHGIIRRPDGRYMFLPQTRRVFGQYNNLLIPFDLIRNPYSSKRSELLNGRLYVTTSSSYCAGRTNSLMTLSSNSRRDVDDRDDLWERERERI